MSEISVIVPVHNVEKYLAYCLDSILAQTFTDFEVICVNDGSTDSSQYILEKYALWDKRIKIINQENQGVAAARNAGLKHAYGKYIAFVDSDDWVSQVMLERLYNNAQKHNSDFVYCNVLYFNNNSTSFKAQEPTMENFEKEFEGKIFNEEMLSPDFFSAIPCNGCACNKLYDKEFLIKNEICFTEGLIFEGVPFFAQAYLKAKTISFEKDFMYFYRAEKDESSTIKDDEKLFDIFSALELTSLIFQKHGKWEKYKTFLLLYRIRILLNDLKIIKPEMREPFINEIKKRYTNVRIDQTDLKALENIPEFKNFIYVIKTDTKQLLNQ